MFPGVAICGRDKAGSFFQIGLFSMTNDELGELRSLVDSLKADRLLQKEKDKGDAWTRYVSLSMIVLAVLAAVATGKAGGCSSTVLTELNEATFNQTQASDQWSYYQAKGIKSALAENEKDQLLALGNADPKRIAELTSKIERYDKERKEITATAKGLEAKRQEARAVADKASITGGALGLASSIFQISIALGGVTLVVKRRWLWYVSLGTGLLATLQMIKALTGQ